MSLETYELIERKDEFIYSELEHTLSGYRFSVSDLLSSGSVLVTSFTTFDTVYFVFSQESTSLTKYCH